MCPTTRSTSALWRAIPRGASPAFSGRHRLVRRRQIGSIDSDACGQWRALGVPRPGQRRLGQPLPLHTRPTSAGPRRPLYGHADRVEDLLRWITTCAYGMLVCSCLAASCYVGGACAGSEADGTVFAPYRARTSPITSLLMGIWTVSTGVINSLSQSSPTRTLFASVGIFAR